MKSEEYKIYYKSNVPGESEIELVGAGTRGILTVKSEDKETATEGGGGVIGPCDEDYDIYEYENKYHEKYMEWFVQKMGGPMGIWQKFLLTMCKAFGGDDCYDFEGMSSEEALFFNKGWDFPQGWQGRGLDNIKCQSDNECRAKGYSGFKCKSGYCMSECS